MQLDFTGRQMEITPALRKYTEKHMRKLTRVLRDRFDVHVILTAEKHRRIAEITLKFRDHVLVGVQETAEVLSSINGAIDKLERDLRSRPGHKLVGPPSLHAADVGLRLHDRRAHP